MYRNMKDIKEMAMKARFSVKTNTNSKTNQSFAFEKKMWQ